MNLNVAQLDLKKTREQWPADVPFSPAYVKKFKPGDPVRWVVLDAPFNPGEKPSWALAEHDEYLRIPLFPYYLSSQSDLALAFMLQFGLSCAGHFPGPVENFFVVTGTPVELLYEPDTNNNVGLRYWVGFAVILK
jgi:hypothetical protein